MAYKRLTDRIEELKIDNPRVASSIKWVNIINAGKDEIDYLRRNYNFNLVHLKTAASSVSFQRPMIFKGDGYLCLVLHFPTLKDENIVAGEVDFFVGHGYLITVHNNTLKVLTHFFSLGKKSPDSLLSYSLESSAILLYEVLGHLMDDCFQLLDDSSLKINEIEELIFTRQQKKAVEKIMTFRRNIINIRKIMQNHKNILQSLMEMESSLVEKAAIKKYYSVLVENSKRIWEMLDNQKEMIEVLNSTNESILNDRMTDIMKTLTIFSVIVFPLTLLAAIFGMNAKYMPFIDHPLGFWMILGIMGFCSIGMVTFFKSKRWI
ncbi:MAG: magnesium transporter CorA family protein [Candidatus Falkowbacteria bacterium]|nr:magnesium transporter CorA family protein [Candidatus Falkowbacteria bacterium]